MTKEQYKAANSKIFPVVMIILGYYLITFLLSILTGNSTWRVWIQIPWPCLSQCFCTH